MASRRPLSRTINSVLVLGLIVASLAIIVQRTSAAAATTAPAAPVVQGDAYASGSGCDWTFGTSKVSETVAFSGDGTFHLVSFRNLVSNREYVQGNTVSPEFSLNWDGAPLSGDTAGWQCASGTVTRPTVGGLRIIQVAVTLTRPSLSVTKYYQVFPLESVVREWAVYTNTGSASHVLADPSFVAQNLMTTDIGMGDVDLRYMLGAACCNAFSWQQQSTTLTSTYSRTFDSYDPLDCVDQGSTPSTCVPGGWKETSSAYIPWFSLWNPGAKDGLLTMFDYMGRWQMEVGAYGGGGSLTGILPNYNSALPAGDSVTSPTATVMTYTTDEDTMTNELLDYQYRYLWDDTRSQYFAKVAAPADWCTGTQWCGQWDQQGMRQKIYGLADLESAAGQDTDWRDNGWWDTPGNWNGPDFQMTGTMLGNLGEGQIIYYPAYDANTNSAVYQQHPDWFPWPSPCGYADRQGDLSNPAFASWMQNLLIDNSRKWGGYLWRNDSCPVANTTGDQQLAQDQAFRNVVSNFISANPDNGWYMVDSGGNEIGLDTVRLSSALNYYDQPGIQGVGASQDQFYDASMLFPVDKISGDPNEWDINGYCTQQIWADLAMNPSYFSSAYPAQSWHADTTDGQQIECARQLSDVYHYLVSQGVAGRWSKQYHPSSNSAPASWFERTNQDGTEAAVIHIGATTTSSVTVRPSGLNLDPSATYDVESQFTDSPQQMTGAQIASGITLPSGAAQGQIIYINLPGRPGAHNDTTRPSAPPAVTAVASTDVNYPDVIVSWKPATDNNWVSYYKVYRDGVLIGTSTKTSYLDHTPAASPFANYGVQAVDGAGNTSPIAQSAPPGPSESTPVDDSSSSITYSGSCTTPQNAPVGEWRLNDPSGAATAADSSGNGNAGTVKGAVSFGQPGTLANEPNDASASFDGTTAFIDLGNPAALQNDSGTVTAWIKTTSTDSGYHAIAIKWFGYSLFVQNGDLVTFDWSTDTEHDSGVKVADGNWHQVVLSYQSGVTDGTTMYVDGQQAGPATTITVANQGNDALIGSGDTEGVEYFQGNIDDVAFYAQPLTAAQVQQDYASASYAPTYPGHSVPCWQHQTGDAGAYSNTQSVTSLPGASASYTFTGSAVTAFFQMGPDEGTTQISVDGKTATLDLYAPDALNYSMPIFTRNWPGKGQHTITITATGSKNPKSSGAAIRFDGLQVRNASTGVTDDSGFSYSGNWSSDNCGSGCDAIDGTLHQSSTAGATATFTANMNEIRLIGNYCANCGEADIYVDGKFVTRIDTFGDRGADQTHATLFTDSWPSKGPHTVTVIVDGTKNLDSAGTAVTLDAALVNS